jgi:hypothetical protein
VEKELPDKRADIFFPKTKYSELRFRALVTEGGAERLDLARA